MTLVLLFSAILAAGCSTHYSTLRDSESGDSIIFAMPESEAFQLARGTLATVLPGRKIEAIDGPIRGYSTYFRFLLDTYTQQVLVFSAAGRGGDGEEVRGYYYEVSGSGTSIVQGRNKNIELFQAIKTNATAHGNPVRVTDVRPMPYQQPMQSLPLQDVAGKLEQLKALRDQGLITDQDYEAKKKELLDRM